MKKIFLLVALAAATFTQGFTQNSAKSSALGSLLSSYYDVKNDLIKSNSTDAATHAADFLKAVNAVDMKSLPAADMNAFMSFQDKLAFDAKHISESKDIAHQREHFANFSSNFFKLAKAVKLTDQAVYYDYCPMKKSYWLSADASIKNPYFGSQMLTCGKVTETLNK
ncbi:DUF3347 domain-containing protein [Mucilaginibacter rubeus]|jgi:hypothetical protein|uniref:DUF3347 domain-containing protein n=1 Tax=Mucilaginibacter rubeus TaxID=2027860 RepID=A0AAE6JJJ9_9SPHI|nr:MULTISPECIES: DUF3347 domain-containing protein [Mucilaginibacter]NHA05640.1 DUF3347 domain-containing protein [Mucilaginibacter inviolabilis]QEM07044.1 DUF3347 domain-containing protein [Mucilaginibacter rubeus]QTE35444.1 DUF3347 domain-containing protein [Mucilaginibacter gossypii]QTE43814.1 DUF3347 domain-containing protein [Mucilaginibacter rubeus]QTE50414.1 DUF3347 domain-containing protein [Mucilaginibacter rubeus]